MICTLTQCIHVKITTCWVPFRANWGVKQRDNLSLTLFNLHVGDFLICLHSSDTLPAYLDSIPDNHMFLLMT